MSSMREQLVHQAIGLVRVRGYAGFSYADLSQAVGIRKASIHHHFPAKEDLGEAIVESYSDAFFSRLQAISDRHRSARDRVKAYAEIYRETLKADQGCLCGMLASEVAILPGNVRRGVTRFFERNLRWLEEVLSAAYPAGRQQPSRRVAADIRSRASLILSSLQGALFVARSSANPQLFDDCVRSVLDRLETDVS